MDALPLAELLQALADPTRLRILALLRRMELSVGELAIILDQSQPRVSRHVRILADAGVIDRRREGSWVFLTIAPEGRAAPMFSLIDAWTCEESAQAFEADASKLDRIRSDRAEAATRYFTSHAEVWDSIRSLHVAESEVEEAIGRALGSEDLGCLVDIGTGTGRMIELFGRSASHSIGIDRSSEMLRLARVKLEAAGISSSLRQGDLYSLPLDDGAADTVIIHQVLHYAHSPAAAIEEASRVLAPGGRLLIVDFAAHEREELRTTDAHIRLGFDDDTMTSWFKAAGIAVDHVEHLEGGELTVTVWRGEKAGVRQRERRAA
ncbi:metalloregulator ArsR/SmtB family transcription factor [Sphingomonas daechungensis]|uniref:Metalloregulator ArsR/SmtB family transcription factor n=1 Tax=Sphingomonas daechungensis TaxID=1176646 RepID=A0ABX6T282_9SPHN|nr:metalloregulator ArsR/SmtB family transcription factor [Sphingomonas daechungensis]QNP43644.1 metalloregulator ArsR/SmtB family transcription factor [Sphingomonas daechungensis]